MELFEQFMERTEEEEAGLALTPKTVNLMYPLIYIEKVTNVELRSWVNSGVLHPSKHSNIDFPLYWKRAEDWKFLGYVTLGFSTFQEMAALIDRKPQFMRDADHAEAIKDRIALLFLLGD